MAAPKPIDKKYLEGLVFRTAEKKRTDGKEPVNVPRELPLAEEHVIGWSETADTVMIATADGRKHVVSKKQAKPAKDSDTKK